MDNQTTFKTIKPQPIEDPERYFNNKRILCDIEHLQEQLTEKQMELLANSINPNEYMDKWYKYTFNHKSHMFVHIKNISVTCDGCSIKVYLQLHEPSISVTETENGEVKTYREVTNDWLTESAFRNKKTFSLVRDIKKLPKVN